MGTTVILLMSMLVCIYGDVDIMDVETSGASAQTARQDRLTVTGVPASHKLAEHDLSRMNKYKALITRVGRAKSVDPAVIAAIISRESRAGSVLTDGWGDHGNGWGLMQVDKRHHTPLGAWDSEDHITQGTEILLGTIREIQRKFPRWPKTHQFKGGISAYNAGSRNVRSYERMDIGTPGDDYANDVVARAQWLKSQGY